MSRIRRLGAPFGAFLAILLVVFAFSAIVPATPAFAQTTPTSPSIGGYILDYLNNSIAGNATSFDAVYKANFQILASLGCWGCDVFDKFSGAVFDTGWNVSQNSGPALTSVIVAVASLFSLIYIGSSFVSGDASDLLSRWKVFWQLMIAVTIGSAWLTAGNAFDNTWNIVYGPLMKVPLAVAGAVPQYGGGEDKVGCRNGGSTSSSHVPSGAGDIVKDMRNVVCSGHNVTIKGIAFGMALSSTGEGFVGSILNALAGLAIMVIFAWVMISFPLRFIDVLIRLTVVGIVTPILVVCAVFKPTRSYVKIGISNVLHAGSLFAFTSIMFNLGGSYFGDEVQKRIDSLNKVGAGTELSQSLVLVGTGVIFAAMLKMAPALASEFSQFSGSGGSGVGDSAASFSSSVVTMPVKAATAVVAAKTGAAVVGKAAGGAMASAGGGGGAAGSLGKGVTDKNA